MGEIGDNPRRVEVVPETPPVRRSVPEPKPAPARPAPKPQREPVPA